jgi:hypothetical protein
MQLRNLRISRNPKKGAFGQQNRTRSGSGPILEISVAKGSKSAFSALFQW